MKLDLQNIEQGYTGIIVLLIMALGFAITNGTLLFRPKNGYILAVIGILLFFTPMAVMVFLES